MFRTLFCAMLVTIGGGSAQRVGVIRFPEGDGALVVGISGGGDGTDCDGDVN